MLTKSNITTKAEPLRKNQNKVVAVVDSTVQGTAKLRIMACALSEGVGKALSLRVTAHLEADFKKQQMPLRATEVVKEIGKLFYQIRKFIQFYASYA